MPIDTDFSLSRRGASLDWRFTDASLPFFHKGNDVGCIVQHGFTGTPANMRAVSEALAEAGFTVFAPLLSGHGATLGDMERFGRADWRRDVRAAYDRLRDEGCRKIFALGLSMGGLLSADLAAELPLDGCVLMSTPFRMRPYLISASLLYPFVRFVTLPHKASQDSDKEMYDGMAVRCLVELRALARETRAKLPRITCPALLLQSRLDNRVDLRSVEPARAAIPSSPALIWLESSPHGCTYGPERALAASLSLEFVKSHSM